MTIADINAAIYRKTKTNSTSLPAADLLIMVNNAYEHVASLILQADGRWQWDDSNQTDQPIATTSLVASQQDYTLATSHLRITGMEIKQNNAAGTWMKLNPIDQTDISDDGNSITATAAITGTPLYYDVLGNSILLYPTPSYSQAASLKVYFQRAPVLFTSGDVSTGTKVPGFNSLYHSLISDWVSFEYATDNSLPSANGIFAVIQKKEAALLNDYGKRDKDDVVRLTMNPAPPFK